MLHTMYFLSVCECEGGTCSGLKNDQELLSADGAATHEYYKLIVESFFSSFFQLIDQWFAL